MKQNLQQRKLELIEKILSVKNINDLPDLEKAKTQKNKSGWNDFTDEDIKNLEKGIKSVAKGNFKPHREVRKLYEKWL